jgi:hypothetical protein
MTQESGRPRKMSELFRRDSDLLAVLRPLERSRMMERSIVGGFFLGPPVCLVVSVILGNLLVLVGPHSPEAFSSSINGLTGAYGFFLGIFLGPIVDAIRKDKKATEWAVENVMAQHQLSSSDLARILRIHEKQLPKVAGAYARLMKRKNA